MSIGAARDAPTAAGFGDRRPAKRPRLISPHFNIVDAVRAALRDFCSFSAPVSYRGARA